MEGCYEKDESWAQTEEYEGAFADSACEPPVTTS